MKNLKWLFLFLILLFHSAFHVASAGYPKDFCEATNKGKVYLPYDQETGKVRPECMPEVLYSWKSTAKIQQYLRKLSSSDILPFGNVLWLWRTPIGTFGYGDQPVRIKLKKNLNLVILKSWRPDGGCGQLTKAEKQTTVIFGYYKGGNYSEYMICSSKVIHSWSVGSPEAYHEMKKEYDWIKLKREDTSAYDRFYKTITNKYFTDKDYDRDAFLFFQIDGKDWTERSLKKKLLEVSQKINEGHLGSLVFSPDSSRDRYEHFKVKYPDFFNL